MLTSDGAETNVCCKSGASFAEIGDMIDEAANHDKLNGIVVVGGRKEAMGNVSIDELKERTQLLITKAKSVAEAVTVGSVLPWRDHDPERLAKVNGAIRETCCEMCVKYVDHDGNFTFRDGTVDEAAYVCDGLHLSRGGVDRMLANFALPKRKARKTERQPNTRRDSRRVTPRAAARETTDGTRLARKSRTAFEHTPGHTPCHTVGGHEREHRRRPTGLARRQTSSEHTTCHTQ